MQIWEIPIDEKLILAFKGGLEVAAGPDLTQLYSLY